MLMQDPKGPPAPPQGPPMGVPPPRMPPIEPVVLGSDSPPAAGVMLAPQGAEAPPAPTGFVPPPQLPPDHAEATTLLNRMLQEVREEAQRRRHQFDLAIQQGVAQGPEVAEALQQEMLTKPYERDYEADIKEQEPFLAPSTTKKLRDQRKRTVEGRQYREQFQGEFEGQLKEQFWKHVATTPEAREHEALTKEREKVAAKIPGPASGDLSFGLAPEAAEPKKRLGEINRRISELEAMGAGGGITGEDVLGGATAMMTGEQTTQDAMLGAARRMIERRFDPHAKQSPGRMADVQRRAFGLGGDVPELPPGWSEETAKAALTEAAFESIAKLKRKDTGAADLTRAVADTVAWLPVGIGEVAASAKVAKALWPYAHTAPKLVKAAQAITTYVAGPGAMEGAFGYLRPLPAEQQAELDTITDKGTKESHETAFRFLQASRDASMSVLFSLSDAAKAFRGLKLPPPTPGRVVFDAAAIGLAAPAAGELTTEAIGQAATAMAENEGEPADVLRDMYASKGLYGPVRAFSEAFQKGDSDGMTAAALEYGKQAVPMMAGVGAAHLISAFPGSGLRRRDMLALRRQASEDLKAAGLDEAAQAAALQQLDRQLEQAALGKTEDARAGDKEAIAAAGAEGRVVAEDVAERDAGDLPGATLAEKRAAATQAALEPGLAPEARAEREATAEALERLDEAGNAPDATTAEVQAALATRGRGETVAGVAEGAAMERGAREAVEPGALDKTRRRVRADLEAEWQVVGRDADAGTVTLRAVGEPSPRRITVADKDLGRYKLAASDEPAVGEAARKVVVDDLYPVAAEAARKGATSVRVLAKVLGISKARAARVQKQLVEQGVLVRKGQGFEAAPTADVGVPRGTIPETEARDRDAATVRDALSNDIEVIGRDLEETGGSVHLEENAERIAQQVMDYGDIVRPDDPEAGSASLVSHMLAQLPAEHRTKALVKRLGLAESQADGVIEMANQVAAPAGKAVPVADPGLIIGNNALPAKMTVEEASKHLHTDLDRATKGPVLDAVSDGVRDAHAKALAGDKAEHQAANAAFQVWARDEAVFRNITHSAFVNTQVRLIESIHEAILDAKNPENHRQGTEALAELVGNWGLADGMTSMLSLTSEGRGVLKRVLDLWHAMTQKLEVTDLAPLEMQGTGRSARRRKLAEKSAKEIAKRRRAEARKAAGKAPIKGKSRGGPSMLTRIKQLGGISPESWKTFPGERRGEFKAPLIVQRGGMSWEDMAKVMASEGYGPVGARYEVAAAGEGSGDTSWFHEALSAQEADRMYSSYADPTARLKAAEAEYLRRFQTEEPEDERASRLAEEEADAAERAAIQEEPEGDTSFDPREFERGAVDIAAYGQVLRSILIAPFEAARLIARAGQWAWRRVFRAAMKTFSLADRALLAPVRWPINLAWRALNRTKSTALLRAAARVRERAATVHGKHAGKRRGPVQDLLFDQLSKWDETDLVFTYEQAAAYSRLAEEAKNLLHSKLLREDSEIDLKFNEWLRLRGKDVNSLTVDEHDWLIGFEQSMTPAQTEIADAVRAMYANIRQLVAGELLPTQLLRKRHLTLLRDLVGQRSGVVDAMATAAAEAHEKRARLVKDTEDWKAADRELRRARSAQKRAQVHVDEAAQRLARLENEKATERARWGITKEGFAPAVPNRDPRDIPDADRLAMPDLQELLKEQAGTAKELELRAKDQVWSATPAPPRAGHWLARRDVLASAGLLEGSGLRSFFHYVRELYRILPASRWYDKNLERLFGKQRWATQDELQDGKLAGGDREVEWISDETSPSVRSDTRYQLGGSAYEVKLAGPDGKRRSLWFRTYEAAQAVMDDPQKVLGPGEEWSLAPKNEQVAGRKIILLPTAEAAVGGPNRKARTGEAPIEADPDTQQLLFDARHAKVLWPTQAVGRVVAREPGKFHSIAAASGRETAQEFTKFIHRSMQQIMGREVMTGMQRAATEFASLLRHRTLGLLNPKSAIKEWLDTTTANGMWMGMDRSAEASGWASEFAERLGRAHRKLAAEPAKFLGEITPDPKTGEIRVQSWIEGVKTPKAKLDRMGERRRAERVMLDEAFEDFLGSWLSADSISEHYGMGTRDFGYGEKLQLQARLPESGADALVYGKQLAKATRRGLAKASWAARHAAQANGMRATWIGAYMSQRRAGASREQARTTANNFALAQGNVGNRISQSKAFQTAIGRLIRPLASWNAAISATNWRHMLHTNVAKAASRIAYYLGMVYLVQQAGQLLDLDPTQSLGGGVAQIPLVGPMASWSLKKLEHMIGLAADPADAYGEQPKWRQDLKELARQHAPEFLREWLMRRATTAGGFPGDIPVPPLWGTWSPYVFESANDFWEGIKASFSGDEKTSLEKWRKFVVGNNYWSNLWNQLYGTKQDPSDPSYHLIQAPLTGITRDRVKSGEFGTVIWNSLVTDIETSAERLRRSVIDPQRDAHMMAEARTHGFRAQRSLIDAQDLRDEANAAATPEAKQRLAQLSAERGKDFMDQARALQRQHDMSADEVRAWVRRQRKAAEANVKLTSSERDILNAYNTETGFKLLSRELDNVTDPMTKARFNLIASIWYSTSKEFADAIRGLPRDTRDQFTMSYRTAKARWATPAKER